MNSRRLPRVERTSGLGMHRNEVVKYVEQFLAEERIDSRRRDYRTYYMVRE